MKTLPAMAGFCQKRPRVGRRAAAPSRRRNAVPPSWEGGAEPMNPARVISVTNRMVCDAAKPCPAMAGARQGQRLSFPASTPAPRPASSFEQRQGRGAVRLTSIKLSGFKSFAEPTNFLLPGQLVGVVGPNGCGKSNIMDAVRWVLGESRASELRGESMQDVIYNGTTTRKPASRSSVELVFDNADHRAGGQWAQFTEIAVKRVLTRDGTSSYYINNQPVRRRDVQDVFLGTGLGPRAYAIIGQGTISRIIESKPEELRLFLEEAAGVSKYKERRRETE